MARIKKSVDRNQLQDEINRLETKKPFPNHSKLFQAIARSDWGKKNGVTASVAGLRYKEFNLTSKTKAGKRGRPPGAKNGQRETGARAESAPTVTQPQIAPHTVSAPLRPDRDGHHSQEYLVNGKPIHWVEMICLAYKKGLIPQHKMTTRDAARYLRRDIGMTIEDPRTARQQTE